jgi:hypothetical protein
MLDRKEDTSFFQHPVRPRDCPLRQVLEVLNSALCSSVGQCATSVWGMPWSRCWLWGNPRYSVNPMRQFTPLQTDMYKCMYIVPRARWLNSRFEQNAAPVEWLRIWRDEVRALTCPFLFTVHYPAPALPARLSRA